MKEILNHDVCTPTFLILIGFLGMMYLKTVKHLFISRCTSIECCGISCERDVIDSEQASELASTTTQDCKLDV
jgi:hypothetical protein